MLIPTILLMGLIQPGGKAPIDPPEKATVTAAVVEMSNLAQAMEIFFIDHDRFTTLENLDDLAAPNPNRPWQNINDGGGALVFRPSDSVLFRQFFPPETYPGPYMSGFQDHRIEGPDGDYDLGTPLDPWGSPYYFYSPLGLIEPRTDSISLRYYGDAFDRYTIISHGPDGIPMTEADLGWQFGITITVATISSATVLPEATKGGDRVVRIRGYNLGSNTGQAAILADGEEWPATITSWEPSEILLETIPPSDGAEISVRLATGATTRSVGLTSSGGTSVVEWVLFD